MRTCCAPMTEDEDPELCGAPATEQRTLHGVVVDLCARCASDFDAEFVDTVDIDPMDLN